MTIYKIPEPPIWLTPEQHDRFYRDWHATQLMNAHHTSFESYARDRLKQGQAESPRPKFHKHQLDLIQQLRVSPRPVTILDDGSFPVTVTEDHYVPS